MGQLQYVPGRSRSVVAGVLILLIASAICLIYLPTTVLAQSQSNDATLSALTLSNVDFGSFDPETLEYTAQVFHGITHTNVTATRNHPKATYLVKLDGVTETDGSVSLSAGSNVITVEVTAEDGQTMRTYSVTVTRPVSNNAHLINLTLSGISLEHGSTFYPPGFSGLIFNYTPSVAHSLTQTTVTPRVHQSFATYVIKLNGVTDPDGVIALSVGSNVITIEVTAEDGATTKTYTVTVTRAAAPVTDATLKRLALSSIDIGGGVGEGADAQRQTLFNASVYHSVSQTTVTPTVNHSGASYVIKLGGVEDADGTISLAVGSNVITVEVTAEDDTTIKTYTVTVNRATASAPTTGLLSTDSPSVNFRNISIDHDSAIYSFNFPRNRGIFGWIIQRYEHDGDSFVSSGSDMRSEHTGSKDLGGEGFKLGDSNVEPSVLYQWVLMLTNSQGSTVIETSLTVRAPALLADPAPDLEIGTPSVDDASLSTGSQFTLSVTVTNAGDEASEATRLRYYRSTDSTITSSDTEQGSESVGALAAAGTSDHDGGMTAPSEAGTYYYGACVDSVTDESDTTDNCSSSVQVTVSEPAPDLVVIGIDASDNIVTGGSFRVGVTVTNQGDAQSAATTLRWKQEVDGTTTEIGTAAQRALTPPQGSFKTIRLTAPSTPGTSYYWACVDSVADESDTTNNCSGKVTVTVTNNLATGAPTITGTAQVGETLTASTSGIADDDGLTSVSYSYQWVSNDGTADTDIQDATSSTYTLVDGDAGNTIKVKVSFTDDNGNAETLTSSATAAVDPATAQQGQEPVNSEATGAPTITGTAQVGETLTASTSGIADDDGLTSVSYSYQWVSNDGTADTDIQDATSSTYTLVDGDAGNTIKVKVSFTDDNGNAETLTSSATAAVAAAVPGAPTGLTATASGPTGIGLSWNTPADDGGGAITGYRIEMSTDGSNWSDQVASTNSTSTTYSHTGLTLGDTRHYRVSAINPAGTGPVSNVASATTAATPPGSASAARSFSAASVAPGGQVTVTITAANYGTFGRVTETLPEGFTYLSSSLPDFQVTEANARTVRFNLLENASFTYAVTASSVEDSYSFSGTLTDTDMNEHVVGGAATVTVSSGYDTNGDGAIDIGELFTAIDDYFAGLISIGELFTLIDLYFSGPA